MQLPQRLRLLSSHEVPRPRAAFKNDGGCPAADGDVCFIEALNYRKLRRQRLRGGANAKV
jgi:hypothetical protein